MEQKRLQKKKTFPEQLKYQRELRGWSQAKMAEEIGATPNRISSWERSVALPGAYFREQLCRLLNMNAQELGLLSSSDSDDDEISSSHDIPPEPDTSSAQNVSSEQAISPAQDTFPEQDIEVSARQFSVQPAYMLALDAVMPAQEDLQVHSTPPPTPLPYRFTARKRTLRVPVLMALVVVVLLMLGSMAWYGLSNGVFALGQANPYPPNRGQLVLEDALQHQNSERNWQQGTNDKQASCSFADNGYVVFVPLSLAGYFHACVAQKTDYTNFTYEVTMMIEQGEFGGIVFRAEDSNDFQYYLFRVHTDGSYYVYRYVDRTIDHAILLQQSSTQVFNKGLGKRNIIAVVAQGSSLTFYINHQEVCALQDAGYTHGQIGVLAGSLNQAPSRAIFTNAKVWAS